MNVRKHACRTGVVYSARPATVKRTTRQRITPTQQYRAGGSGGKSASGARETRSTRRLLSSEETPRVELAQADGSERSLMSAPAVWARLGRSILKAVRGPILHRYGERLQGELRWKGMMVDRRVGRHRGQSHRRRQGDSGGLAARLWHGGGRRAW